MIFSSTHMLWTIVFMWHGLCPVAACKRCCHQNLCTVLVTLHCACCGLDKNIVSTTAPNRAVLSVLSLGVALWAGQSGASEAAETCIFLASIWLAFTGHVVLFWYLASLAREMDSAGRQWKTEKDVWNVRDFHVKRLPSGGTRSCMPQQTWYASVCAYWEQKLCVFWSRLNAHRDRPCHCQWASSLAQHLWLARFI